MSCVVHAYPPATIYRLSVCSLARYNEQSFRQVWYKSAVDCMRNANNKSKNPLFRNGEENN